MASQLAILGGQRTVPEGAYGLWPDIHEADKAAVMSVLERGILTGGGSVEAPGFERDYAEYVGSEHCLAFNSGTGALHACAVASGLVPGDEAIVPAFTYVASAMFLALHGVRPVFADIDLDTYLIDVRDAERKITSSTKAIVAVHLHGLPCDMESIRSLADRHGLVVIEDISQAHGATYKGQTVGSFGHTAGGSLNATKNLPGGEGGMFLTDDEDAVVVARRLRYQGEDPVAVDPELGRRYWSFGLGYNYRPQEMPFAFARSQLKRLDVYNRTAQRNAEILNEGLRQIPGIAPPAVPAGREHVWYIYRARLEPEALGFDRTDAELRDRVMAALAAEGVHVTLWQHHPIPAFTTFRRRNIVPWTPESDGDELLPWDPSEYPASIQACENTFVIGSGATPLAAQSEDLVRSYVDAIGKVLESIDQVREMAFESPASSVDAALYDRTNGREGAPSMVPIESATASLAR